MTDFTAALASHDLMLADPPGDDPPGPSARTAASSSRTTQRAWSTAPSTVPMMQAQRESGQCGKST